MRREKVIRIGAIVIILALLLSLLAGAFSITPAQASGPQNTVESVQVLAADDTPLGDSPDTDRDGIINNEDPDIDGDGVVNGTDPDIDGDGKPNFSDGDPAETNGIDTNAPNHPEGVTVQNLVEDNPGAATALAVLAALILAGLAWFFRVKKRRK